MSATIIFATLAVATLGPLLLLAAYVLADRLGLKGADRLLDWTMYALIGQWRLGSLINLLGGCASVAGGAYLASDLSRPLHVVAAALLIPLGLWRIWRGRAAWSVSAALADEMKPENNHGQA